MKLTGAFGARSSSAARQATPDVTGRSPQELIRSIGLGLLAGVVAAGFAVGIAFLLRISPLIAGLTTGIVTALFVAQARYRDGPGDVSRPV